MMQCAALRARREGRAGAGGEEAQRGGPLVQAVRCSPKKMETRQSSLLSLLDDASLTTVAMFLSARDLLRLALVCRRFGRCDAVGAVAEHGGSLAYEAARLQLLRRPPTSRAMLMPLAAASAPRCWLGRLQEMETLECPLEFTRVGPRVLIQDAGLLVRRSGVTCHSGHRAAIVGRHRMCAGRHFARSTSLSLSLSLSLALTFSTCPSPLTHTALGSRW